MAQVTQDPTNDTDTPATSQDVPTTVAGEATAANDSIRAVGQRIVDQASTEITVEDDQAVHLARQAGLSINPGESLKLTVIAKQDEARPVSDKISVHPQESMTNFWLNFMPDYQGMVTQVLPDALIKKLPAAPGYEKSPKAGKSYEEAKADCIRAVKRITRECQELNMKYSDPHFDIERDLKISGERDCLDGLVPNDLTTPGDVKRVTDIFTDPKFFENGATSNDIRQGISGNCWFLSALSALCSNEDLIRKVCVIQSQAAGVYGFVFHRDGEWQQCIIDDKLYLRAPAYDECGDQIVESYNLAQNDPEAEYTRLFQTGSKALIFAQSADQSETWVPLLEKAFAKAHGDYAAIEGGQTGEAIEDLTGGVTTEIYTTNILSKDDFWTNELSKVGKDFLFSCGLAIYKNWRRDADESDRGMLSRAVQEQRQSGLVGGHAYAVLATYEGFGKRLVKVRNPWGKVEWNGPWSDGSKEWTDGDGDWAKRLNHKFGDDGIFWMSYTDFLKRYAYIDRTRIFAEADGWRIAHAWTSIQVPWSTADYHDTKFSVTVPAATAAVIVLSQLDSRYYRGLEGRYEFRFKFRMQKDSDKDKPEDDDEDDYLARSRINYELSRSVNIEVNLEPGTYTVLMKVEATDVGRDEPETVIRNNIMRREKIIQAGKSYDLAHRKGITFVPKGAEEKTTETAVADGPDDTPTTSQPATPDNSATTQGPTPDSTPNPADPARNPWNAATIVGLKVYSKDPDLSISVVTPPPPLLSPLPPAAAADTSESTSVPEGKDTKEEGARATLDGDDAAKAALDQEATKKADSLAKAPAEADTPTAELPIRVDLP